MAPNTLGHSAKARLNDRGALVKPADQVEQHLPAAHRERQVAEFVENDEIDPDKLVRQLPGLAGVGLGLELVDQIDGGEETHTGAVAHAIGADRYGNVAMQNLYASVESALALAKHAEEWTWKEEPPKA